MRTYRTVSCVVSGHETQDGAGVKLTRLLGARLQRQLDPFLMLDAFCSDQAQDYLGGFPDHPHRGFETLTYMIAGRMRHHDSGGNRGVIGPGGAQWMVAGSGLIHSEFPEQTEGHMEGFQLWINLPAADKLCPPAYRDFLPEELPRVSPSEGAELVVLAGDINGVRGPIGQPRTDCLFLDIHLLGDAAIELPIPRGHTAFLCPYRGPLSVEGCEVPDRHLAILTQSGDSLRLHATGYRRAILVAGRPLGEPIAQHGPFVMNTAQELLAALSDYQNGVFARASVARL